MKRITILILAIAATFLLGGHEIFGRGGGGGGRGGGGGGGRVGGGGGGFSGGGAVARPSPAAGRSPSLGGGQVAARPGVGAAQRPAAGAPRPGVGAGGVAPGGRPNAGQLNNFLDIPSAGTGAVRPGAGGAAADFLQGGGARPGQLPAGGTRPGNLAGGGAARQNISGNRAGRIENRQEWQGNRQQRRDEVRNQVAQNHPRLDFWSDHPNWAAWRINRPYRWATWAAITGWVGAGWTDESAYAYGDNVYYSEDQVYYGDQPVATADEYTQQAETIAASAPDVKPENAEWMPLGVFALTQDGQATGADPTMFMQLAISKEGIINGTLKNEATGQTQDLEGMADKKSQRVAWTVKGQQRPILETGIANLTKDTAPALIHFADGQTQQWLLVRLEEPKQ